MSLRNSNNSELIRDILPRFLLDVNRLRHTAGQQILVSPVLSNAFRKKLAPRSRTLGVPLFDFTFDILKKIKMPFRIWMSNSETPCQIFIISNFLILRPISGKIFREKIFESIWKKICSISPVLCQYGWEKRLNYMSKAEIAKRIKWIEKLKSKIETMFQFKLLVSS